MVLHSPRPAAPHDSRTTRLQGSRRTPRSSLAGDQLDQPAPGFAAELLQVHVDAW